MIPLIPLIGAIALIILSGFAACAFLASAIVAADADRRELSDDGTDPLGNERLETSLHS